jgi:hypothetical protein
MGELVNLNPSQNVYWIVVSHEGPARIPVAHKNYSEAEKEALRLTTAHPGINFTVFESVVSYQTPVANTQKTMYNKPWTYQYSYVTKPYGY